MGERALCCNCPLLMHRDSEREKVTEKDGEAGREKSDRQKDCQKEMQ